MPVNVDADVGLITIVEADRFALLALLARDVDDAMLEWIAAADHGSEMRENLAALRLIRDGIDVEVSIVEQAREVLELTRWLRPETSKTEVPIEVCHRMRGFACAVLLSYPKRRGECETVIQFINSLRTLACDADREAAGLLLWLLLAAFPDDADRTRRPRDEDDAFFGVGLLWFGLRLNPPASDVAVVTLAGLICDWEKASNEKQNTAYGFPAGAWLLSTTWFNQKNDDWRELGGAILEVDLGPRSAEAREWVELIGTALKG